MLVTAGFVCTVVLENVDYKDVFVNSSGFKAGQGLLSMSMWYMHIFISLDVQIVFTILSAYIMIVIIYRYKLYTMIGLIMCSRYVNDHLQCVLSFSFGYIISTHHQCS